MVHPLWPLILKELEKRGEIDLVTAVHPLGTCSGPKKGRDAYRLVALDVLECMTDGGVLVREGSGNPRRPIDGGFFWKLKNV